MIVCPEKSEYIDIDKQRSSGEVPGNMADPKETLDSILEQG